MKTAIYIRVSTEEQVKEGYSISAQTQKLKAFCISQGWDIVEIYPDEGISAKDMNRPNLKRMLKDIELGKVECVLVYRLDRLTRSVLDLYKMLELFDKYDCKFKSATEVYDTTSAMGRMFITIVAALAQWERENLGERISFGYTEKVRQGKYAHNVEPIGFNLDKVNYKLKINEKEAKTIRLIFELYQGGYGANRVCKKLNDAKIYTKAGNAWLDKTLMQIIRNPIYCGDTKWKDVVIENTHEGIITREEFNNAQRLIAERRTATPRSVSSSYFFSGKLKCPNCGRSLVGYYVTSNYKDKSTKYYQYRCREKRRGRCKGSKSVSERKLEIAFIDYLETISFDNFLDKAAEQGEKSLNKEVETVDYKNIEKEIKKIENRKKKWQYAWTEDVMSFEDFKIRMEEANKEEEELRAQLDVVEVEEVEGFSKNEIINVLKHVSKNWYHLKSLEKKNLVDSIIKEIHYQHGKNCITIDSIDFK